MKNIQILLLTMLVVGTVLFFTRNRTRLDRSHLRSGLRARGGCVGQFSRDSAISWPRS